MSITVGNLPFTPACLLLGSVFITVWILPSRYVRCLSVSVSLLAGICLQNVSWQDGCRAGLGCMDVLNAPKLCLALRLQGESPPPPPPQKNNNKKPPKNQQQTNKQKKTRKTQQTDKQQQKQNKQKTKQQQQNRNTHAIGLHGSAYRHNLLTSECNFMSAPTRCKCLLSQGKWT